MANNRAAISDAIKTKLLTVSSLHSRVYDHNPTEFIGFPSAVVRSAGHDEEIADNATDLRIYDFDIVVYVERNKENFGTEKTERIRREVEDDIFAAFDTYQTLGGACLWMRLKSGGWGYSADNSFSFFILNLTAYQQVAIS